MGQRAEAKKEMPFAWIVVRGVAGIVVLLIIALWLSSIPTTPPRDRLPIIGEHGITKDFPILGCRSERELARYLRLVGDEVATTKFLQSRLLMGQCRMIKAGTEVTVDEMPLLSDNFCVRERGEVECLWTNQGWVLRAQ